MPPHGATTTAATDAAPLGSIPQDPQHTRHPGIRARTGHTGCTYFRLRPMILTDTKMTNQAYFCNSRGYNVVFYPMIMTVADSVQGGGGLAVRDQPQGWSL